LLMPSSTAYPDTLAQITRLPGKVGI